MHRVDGPGNVAGHWVVEDPENNVPGTQITADIMETFQEEIAAVVESRGKVLNKANNHQLLESILEIASGADLIARYATTGNIVLNGDAVQAGGDWPAVLPNGTIVLVRAQTIPQDNGPYVVNATGTWSRLNTFDSSAEIIPGKTIKVTEGVTLADSIWMLTTDAPIVLNSTALVFERKDKQENSAIQGASRYLSVLANGKNSQIAITAAEIIVKDVQGNSKALKNVSFIINTSAAGLNGLDSGALLASTWYAMFIVYNAATDSVGGVISSSLNPALPAGYTYFAWLGDTRTDGSANKYPLSMTQTGRKVSFLLDTASNVPSLPVLAAGIQGSVVTPTYVTSGLLNFISPRAIAVDVTIHAVTTGCAVMVSPNNNYGAFNSTTRPPPLMLTVGNDGVAQNINASKTMLLESMNLYVASSDGNGTVCINGWEYA